MEREVIADIARRVNKTGRFTETAELMAEQLHRQGYSTARIQAEVRAMLNHDPEFQKAIAENTLEYKKMVAEIIKETEEEARRNGDKLVAEAGDMAWREDMSMWEQHGEDLSKPNALEQIKKAISDQTQQHLQNITNTTGVYNATGGAGIENAYRRELDLAIIKITSGNFSVDTAVRDCVQRLAQDGLKVEYNNGDKKRHYHLDTATRMCIRTALNQLTGQIMQENLKKATTPLVYVDAHASSRPEHAVWQGQVYAYNPNGLLKDGTTAGSKYEDFFNATDYGSVTGLMGVNCAHHFYPYWEGDPIPKYKEPEPVKINGKEYTYYEATQEMRKQERNIRALKREIEATKAIGGDVTQLRAKLSASIQNYKGFSAQANINPRPSATRVQFGTSDIRKTKVYQNTVGDLLRNPTPKGYKDNRSVGDYITYEQLKSFSQKADSMGIRTNGFAEYRGAPAILDNILEHLSKTQGLNLKDRGMILNYDNVLGYNGNHAVIDINAFAETKGKVITLNKFMFDDSEYLQKTYNESEKTGYYTKGTSYLNIVDHERGHQFDIYNRGLYHRVVEEIEKMAYSESVTIDWYISNNISQYAGMRSNGGRFTELIAELNAKLNGSDVGVARTIFENIGAINEI